MRMAALLMILASLRPAAGAGAAGSRMVAPMEGDAKTVSVFDGDSFTLAGLPIHLTGIDAPELGQLCPGKSGREAQCGLIAGYELRKRLQLESRPLRCWPQGPETDGAVFATCAAGEDDVALQLLGAGYAFALPDAQIDYRLAEEKARTAGLGLWNGSVTAPWDWRKERETAQVRDPGQGCAIAGTVQNGGTRLYYGPLDPDYGVKIVRPEKGERWFCSEEAARAAGWRRPEETAGP